MKKVWIIIGVLVVIGGLVGVNLWQGTSSTELEVVTTQLEDHLLTSTVMIPGTLTLQNEQLIYASPEKGEVDEILVEVGDQVEEGTALIRYTNDQLKLELEQNELSIESAYIRINHLQKEHERIHEQEEEMAEEIGEEEAAEAIEVEHDQNQMERRMANLELRQALLHQETLEQQVEELEVYSQEPGTVLEVNEDAARSQQMENEALIRIADTEHLIVEGLISEYDTLQIEAGQSVILRSDAVVDEEWEGEVTHLSYLPQASGMETEAVQYPIEVSVSSEGMNLKPGFEMIMEVETDNQEVPTLPIEALIQEDGENIVYIVHEGLAERREIQVGMTSMERIEVVSGMEEDEPVIVDPPPGIRDGTEVVPQ